MITYQMKEDLKEHLLEHKSSLCFFDTVEKYLQKNNIDRQEFFQEVVDHQNIYGIIPNEKTLLHTFL